MRVARGKVVGNTVVVQGEALPEGAEVTVWVDEDGFDLDRESLDELAAADAAIERGEGLTLDELMERIRRIRAA